MNNTALRAGAQSARCTGKSDRKSWLHGAGQAGSHPCECIGKGN